MADSPDYREWVRYAETDLKAARLLASAASGDLGLQAVFWCQQSAEKFLKACLRFRNIQHPKVHDFEKLLRLCEQISPEFGSLLDVTARLQPFAVQARYSFRRAEPETVRQAIEDAEFVRRFCRKQLGLADDVVGKESGE